MIFAATEAFDDDGLPHTLEHLIFLGKENSLQGTERSQLACYDGAMVLPAWLLCCVPFFVSPSTTKNMTPPRPFTDLIPAYVPILYALEDLSFLYTTEKTC